MNAALERRKNNNVYFDNAPVLQIIGKLLPTYMGILFLHVKKA